MLLPLLACTPDKPPNADDTGAPDTGGDTDTTDTRVYADGVWRFDTLDFGAATDDLAPVAEIVGDAEIVGLGESIHYTGGYAAARARLVPWLVEEQGFRAIAVEAGWYNAQTTDAWLRDDEGDLDGAMVGLGFGVWMSQEHAEMLQWVHDWNVANPDDMVALYAFDMQFFWDDFPYLRSVVTETDPDGVDALWAGVAGCLGGTYVTSADYNDDTWAQDMYAGQADYDDETYTTCIAGLDAVDDWVASHTEAIEAAMSLEDVTHAQVAARSVRQMQTELYSLGDMLASYNARDVGMAANFEQLRDELYPGRKTVIIAHNGHLDRDWAAYEASGIDGWVSMGTFVADTHGEDYAPLALLGESVTFDWGCSGDQTIEAALGTLERKMLRTGLELAFVDPERAEASGVLESGDDGAMAFGNPDQVTGIVADHFAGLVYLQTVPTFDPYFACP